MVDRKNCEITWIFKGDQEQFLAWSMRFARYAETLKQGSKKLLKWAEEKESEQIRVRDVVEWGWNEGVHSAESMNEEIHNLIMMYTEGTPQVTTSLCNENGVEAWRRMQCTYNGRAIGNHMEIRRRVDNPPTEVSDNKLMDEVVKWESQVSRLYQLFGETISESQKILALSRMCSKTTAEVVYNSGNKNNYESIKRLVHEYVIRKRESRTTGNNEATVNGVDENGEDEEWWWPQGESELRDVDGLTWGKGGKKGK